MLNLICAFELRLIIDMVIVIVDAFDDVACFRADAASDHLPLLAVFTAS